MSGQVQAYSWRNQPGKWLSAVLILALLNYIAGQLSLLLAIPPGYATAVFPPAGIGLVALLIYGWKIWPGIFLGSWCFNFALTGQPLIQFFSTESLVAASIAAGSVIQAIVGYWLIRRTVPRPYHLIDEKSIVKFLLFGGPVACLISTSWGTLTLWLSGQLVSDIATNWLTWWVGDTLGVIVFAPVLVLAGSSENSAHRDRLASVGIPLLMAFFATVVVFVHASKSEQELLRSRFNDQAEQLAKQVQSVLNNELEVIYGLQSLFAASDEVTRDEFRVFVSDDLKRHPSIKALEWIPRVSPAERAQMEQGVRDSGDTDFTFQRWQEDNAWRNSSEQWSSEYYPVWYLEPFEENRAALGLDLGSNPVRKLALIKARQTNRAVATKRIELAQLTVDRAGILVILPVFRIHKSESVQLERSLGYVLSVYRLSELFSTTMREAERLGLRIEIFDISEPQDEKTLMWQTSDESAERQALDAKYPLKVADRIWEFRVVNQAESLIASDNFAWAIQLGGLLFTGLLGASLLAVTGRAVRFQVLMEEKALLAHEKDRQFQNVGEMINQIFFTTSPDGSQILYISRQYETLFQRSIASLLADADDWLNAIHPEDRDWVSEEFRTKAYTGEYNVEYRIVTPDGQIKWIHSRAFPHYDAGGEVTQIYGFAADVTHLKEASTLANVAFETSPNPKFILNSQLEILRANRIAISLFEEASRPILGSSIIQLLPNSERTRVEAQMRKAIRRQYDLAEDYSEQIDFQLPDGRVMQTNIDVTPLPTQSGDHVLISVFDLSDRLAYVRALNESYQQTQLILDHLPAFVWYKDTENRILRVNKHVADALGLTIDEMEGEPTKRFYPEMADKYFLDDLQVIESGESRLGIIELVENLDDMGWVRTDKIPVLGRNGETTGIIVVATDVTIQKKIEDDLRIKTDQLEERNQEMQQLLYIVSHDLKSPLVTVEGFTGTLEKHLEKGNMDRVHDSIKRIRRATKMMNELINDLLELSRVNRLELQSVVCDVNEIMEDVRLNLTAQIEKTDAKLVVEEFAVNPIADRRLLYQMLQNLVGNALHYGCPEPGMKIEVFGLETETETQIGVRDFGPGIETHHQKKIFELFQRLHSDREGTGLGLAIVEKIMSLHHGRVEVFSEPKAGATFLLSFPKATVSASSEI